MFQTKDYSDGLEIKRKLQQLISEKTQNLEALKNKQTESQWTSDSNKKVIFELNDKIQVHESKKSEFGEGTSELKTQLSEIMKLITKDHIKKINKILGESAPKTLV